jgi:hypothetical protein
MPSAVSSDPVAGLARAQSVAGKKEDAQARKRREAEIRKKRAKIIGPLEKKVAATESRIAEMEEAQSERSSKLADPRTRSGQGRNRRGLAAQTHAADRVLIRALVAGVGGRFAHAAAARAVAGDATGGAWLTRRQDRAAEVFVYANLGGQVAFHFIFASAAQGGGRRIGQNFTGIGTKRGVVGGRIRIRGAGVVA